MAEHGARRRAPMDTSRRRAADAVLVAAGAAALTAVLAGPVLAAPSERIFGPEIAGRHADPFAVMFQFTQPVHFDLHSQPLTDLPGTIIAAVTGPIAAYNWLVLVTFPLAAALAFLLARHLDLSRAASVFAAFAFAFSPFHVAQAAYHPHVAQVQWLPLYLLLLWRSLDRWSPAAAAALVLASAGVALSNFYAGLITIVVTPVAIALYFLARVRGRPNAVRSLWATLATLGVAACGGLAYVWRFAPIVLSAPTSLGFPRADLFKYSAAWWSYLVPPVVNPWLGGVASRIWSSAGVGEGLLEQQVTIGAGVVALGLVAVGCWGMKGRAGDTLSAVPVLAGLALAALLCSLAPERVVHGIRIVGPSSWLASVAPMFRSYARFGVVVQLMAALLAGVGLDVLRRAVWRGRRIAGFALAALVVLEYAAAPAALSRDVLPTPAHRWIADRQPAARALDCVAPGDASSYVPWLSGGRIVLLGGEVSDCDEPHLPGKLDALGLSYVIVRQSMPAGRMLTATPPPSGLRPIALRGPGRMFEIVASRPAIFTGAMPGFYPRESDAERTWRWMGAEAAWEVVNTTPHAIDTTLHLELQSFQNVRRLQLLLDAKPQQLLTVGPAWRWQTMPMTLPPGTHVLTFRALDPPVVADAATGNGDRRPLSVAVGGWGWSGVE